MPVTFSILCHQFLFTNPSHTSSASRTSLILSAAALCALTFCCYEIGHPIHGDFGSESYQIVHRLGKRNYFADVPNLLMTVEM